MKKTGIPLLFGVRKRVGVVGKGLSQFRPNTTNITVNQHPTKIDMTRAKWTWYLRTKSPIQPGLPFKRRWFCCRFKREKIPRDTNEYLSLHNRDVGLCLLQRRLCSVTREHSLHSGHGRITDANIAFQQPANTEWSSDPTLSFCDKRRNTSRANSDYSDYVEITRFGMVPICVLAIWRDDRLHYIDNQCSVVQLMLYHTCYDSYCHFVALERRQTISPRRTQ